MFPRGERVLGWRLLPLTLGHCLLLERLGSPFMPEGARRSPGPGDVAMVLWACSRPWLRAFRSVSGWRARWARAWIAGKVRRRLPEAIAALIGFIERQTSGPRVISVHSSGQLEAPAFAALLATLMAELNMPDSAALDRPVAWCRWMAVTQAERSGLVRLRGQPTEDLIAAAREVAQAECRQGASHGR